MRILLVFLSLLATSIQPAGAKPPTGCADLLRAHVAETPRFTKWRHTYDAITGRGEVKMVLKVHTAGNTRDPRTLSLPPWRTMRVLEPFTYREGDHTYYVVEGDAHDFELYGADLTRDFGPRSPGVQIIGAARPKTAPRLMHEIFARVPMLEIPTDAAHEWLEKKSPLYSRYAAWFGRRTARLARWLQNRRVPDVTPDAGLRERIEACATPFCVFEPLDPADFDDALNFLRQRNPGFDPTTPGHLPRMFVNVLDQLTVIPHDKNSAAIAATGVSHADVTDLATADAQGHVFAAFDVLYRALVDSGRWTYYRHPVAHDVAFLDHVIAVYQNQVKVTRRQIEPWRITLDQWRAQKFERLYFDEFYWRFFMNTPLTIVTDEPTGRRWAVVNSIAFPDVSAIKDYLLREVGLKIPVEVRDDFDRYDVIPTATPDLFGREHGVPLFDRAADLRAIARVGRPSKDGFGHHGDIVIVPLTPDDE